MPRNSESRRLRFSQLSSTVATFSRTQLPKYLVILEMREVENPYDEIILHLKRKGLTHQEIQAVIEDFNGQFTSPRHVETRWRRMRDDLVVESVSLGIEGIVEGCTRAWTTEAVRALIIYEILLSKTCSTLTYYYKQEDTLAAISYLSRLTLGRDHQWDINTRVIRSLHPNTWYGPFGCELQWFDIFTRYTHSDTPNLMAAYTRILDLPEFEGAYRDGYWQ